jgi:hypothetical protein
MRRKTPALRHIEHTGHAGLVTGSLSGAAAGAVGFRESVGPPDAASQDRSVTRASL